MANPIRGLRILVTGATSGVGQALVAELVERGAEVLIHGRDRARVAAVGEGLRIASERRFVADLSHLAQVVQLGSAASASGPLDVLVNNAGVMSDVGFLDLEPQEWDRVLETNLRGYFLVGQAVARRMAERRSGRIVNVSSTRQTQAWPGSSAYCASKGGIAMLTKVMAVELAPLGIRVNSIAPGTILTDLNRHYLSDPDFQARRIASIPAGRLGAPDDVVGAAVFLASDEADFLVGASIMIDGGQTLM